LADFYLRASLSGITLYSARIGADSEGAGALDSLSRETRDP